MKGTDLMTDAASSWYAVRSATRRESSAYDGLIEHHFTVFMPFETFWRPARFGNVKTERPLYRGYMFVLCSPEDFHQILDIEGVHQFVRYMVDDILVPMPIPTAAIIEIQADERRGEFDYTRTYTPPYRPKKGDKVKVTSGTWQSFIGRVLNTPTRDRALVMIEGPCGGGKTFDISQLSAA